MIHAPKIIKKPKEFVGWKKKTLPLPLHKPYFCAYEEKFVLLTPCKSVLSCYFAWWTSIRSSTELTFCKTSVNSPPQKSNRVTISLHIFKGSLKNACKTVIQFWFFCSCHSGFLYNWRVLFAILHEHYWVMNCLETRV